MVLPERIGRYEIQTLLGRGGQGTVLLAWDSDLDRRVAIKLLQAGGLDQPASEGRIISRLQHPNIVTLYDVGSYRHLPYLVLEFIDGESLESRIQREGPLGLSDSVVLTSQILGGVAYLHENNVIHCDLTPANILISRDGVPKVTDFGLSVLHQRKDPTEQVVGTLRYMAPETLRSEPFGPYSDVFTMGVVFFEMLSGRRLFAADTQPEIIAAILDDPPINASAHGLSLDPKLAKVLARASERVVASRYANAREMKAALDAYRLPRDQDFSECDAPVQHSTVEFLIGRISRKTGFSSLSGHIGELYKLTSDDSVAPASKLVNVLAKDMTLSRRILTLANSALYGRSDVSDLPGAVRLLGLDQVRVCVTNALMEREFGLGSDELREAMLSSFHSAVLAKAIARDCGVRNAADAFTGAMFHELGRTLTIHYLYDEFRDIVERSAQLHSDELSESRTVLGIPYYELGVAIGQQWQLGDTIVACMQRLPRGELPAPDSPRARLHACAAFANAISHVLLHESEEDARVVRICALLERVGVLFDGNLTRLNEALAETSPLAAKYANLIRLDPIRSADTTRLTDFTPLLASD